MLARDSERALAAATGVHCMALQGSARPAAAAAESEGRERPADAAGKERGTSEAAPSMPTALGARLVVSKDAPLMDEFDAQAAFQMDDDGALAAHGTGSSTARVEASGFGLYLHHVAGPHHQLSPPGT